MRQTRTHTSWIQIWLLLLKINQEKLSRGASAVHVIHELLKNLEKEGGDEDDGNNQSPDLYNFDRLCLNLGEKCEEKI